MNTFPLRRRLALRERPLHIIRNLETAFALPGTELDGAALGIPELMVAYLLHARVLVKAGRAVPRDFDVFVSNVFSRMDAEAAITRHEVQKLCWHLRALFAACDDVKDERPWREAYLDSAIKTHVDGFQWRGTFAQNAAHAAQA